MDIDPKLTKSYNPSERLDLVIPSRTQNQVAKQRAGTVIEEYVNGTSGYRIWGSGYCEQWGRTVFPKGGKEITLLKKMRNTDYMVTYDYFGGVPSNYGEGISVDTRDTTFFKAHGYHSTATNDESANWKVCGYLAEGEY